VLAVTTKEGEDDVLGDVPWPQLPLGVLGVLELLIVPAMYASLVSGEFLPSRQKSLLQVSLGVTLLLFAFLAFGQIITSNFTGILQQYTYFGVTILIIGLVSALPPNRPSRWLTTEYFRETLDKRRV
jgi:hypothetical protein